MHRLPEVYAALLAGRCDEPRARIFSDWTAELDAEAARGVCTTLLPQVAQLTTGQLIEAIKTLAVAIDPDWAHRRYQQAIERRVVIGRRNSDGSANLSGYNLPVERVARASARIGDLAKAAKVAGDTRPIDHLRADLFLGMTDGSYLGLDDEEILALLATEREGGEGDPNGAEADGGAGGGGAGGRGAGGGGAGSGVAGDADTHEEAAARDTRARDTEVGDTEVHDDDVRDDANSHDDAEVHGPATGGGPANVGTEHAAEQGTVRAPDVVDATDPADAPDSAEGGTHNGRAVAPPAGPARRRGGLELRACLSTLLGLDRRPGELVGWSAIHAELVRDLVGTGSGPAPSSRAQWRYVLTDDAGYFAFTGLLAARPAAQAGTRSAGRSVSRGTSGATDVVELAVRLADLPGLAEAVAGGAYPDWAPVISELVRRAADATQASTDDPTRRLPNAALRRHLEARDRRCRGVGCRVPASAADIDHTRDYAAGGPTIAINLGPMYKHDHRLKHAGGWHLDQPEPGVFVWTSRLGQRYVVRPKPVIEELPSRSFGTRHRGQCGCGRITARTGRSWLTRSRSRSGDRRRRSSRTTPRRRSERAPSLTPTVRLAMCANHLVPAVLWNSAAVCTPCIEVANERLGSLMRIVFLAWRDLANPLAGGSEVLVDRLAAGMAERGHDVTLLCGGPTGQRSYAVERTGGTYGQYLTSPMRTLRRHRHTDLVVDVANGSPFFTPVWRRGPSLCLVNHVHRDQWALWFPRPVAALGRGVETQVVPALYRNQLFAVVSESTASELAGLGIRREAIRVVHNGVDACPDGPCLGQPIKSAEPLFVALGRLVPHKRFDTLLRVWEKVRPVTGGRLVIAGEGPERERLQAVAGPGVSLPGRISERVKHELLSAAWLFVHPSLVEGWGLVVMEAAIHATPTVGFDVPGLRDSVVTGESGILASSEEELAQAWITLGTNAASRTALGQAAGLRATRFTWTATVDAFAEVAHEAVSWHPPRRRPGRPVRPVVTVPAPTRPLDRLVRERSVHNQLVPHEQADESLAQWLG